MTPATSGPMSPASSPKSSPGGSFLRMSGDTSPLALRPCCEPYGKWVSRLRLAYSQRAKLARRMKDSGFSSWPTVQARDVRMGDGPDSERRARKIEQGWSQNLNDVSENWTTPQAHDVTPRGRGQVPSAKAGNACLATDAQNWGTPRASDAEKGGPNQAFGSGGQPLPAQAAQWPAPTPMQTREGWTESELREAREKVKATAKNGNGFGLSLGAAVGAWPSPFISVTTTTMIPGEGFVLAATTVEQKQWPTPASRDHKGENSPDHLINGTGRLHMDQLPNAVAHGFTHPDLAPMTHGPTLSQLRRIWRPLRASLIASHGRAVWLRLWTGRAKKRLNPLFVEWLMGWPPGHALCDCSEMEWHLWQRHMRGALSRLPMASGPWIWKPPAPELPKMQQLGLFDAA